jgi:hypothetical protein
VSKEKVMLFLMVGLGISLLLLFLWCCFKKKSKASNIPDLTPSAIAAGGMQNYQGQLQTQNITNQQANQQINNQIAQSIAPQLRQPMAQTFAQTQGQRSGVQQLQHGHFIGEMTPAGPIAGEITASAIVPQDQAQRQTFSQTQGGGQMSQMGQGFGGNTTNQFRMTNSTVLQQPNTDMVAAMNMSVAKGLMGQAQGNR